MPLKRLTPTIKDLGYLRLWQDEIEEIVTLVRQQLSNETIILESDGNELDDIATDLPKLGRRMRYFIIKVTGKRDDETGIPGEILTVTLRKGRCKIEAKNPDAATRGVISDIQDIAQRCRRLPLWYPQLGIFSLNPPATSDDPAPSPAVGRQLIFILLVVLSAAGTLIGAFSVPGTFEVGTPPHRLPLGGSLAILIPCAVTLIALITGEILARTILFTGTRQDAPTFWQRNLAGLVINVVVAAAFFLLGLLVGNS